MNEVAEVPTTATDPEKTRPVTEKVNSVAEWKGRSQRTITLPSGTQVDIVLPDILAMSEAGEIPNELIDTAADVMDGRSITPSKERLAKMAELNRRIVVKMVKYPELAIGDVDALPADDVEMLQSIAMRQTDFDALGEHISGLDKVSSFRRFRGLDD